MIRQCKVGTKVLIKAEIVRRLLDKRPRRECGYLIRTSRGTCMVEPDEIFEPLAEEGNRPVFYY